MGKERENDAEKKDREKGVADLPQSYPPHGKNEIQKLQEENELLRRKIELMTDELEQERGRGRQRVDEEVDAKKDEGERISLHFWERWWGSHSSRNVQESGSSYRSLLVNVGQSPEKNDQSDDKDQEEGKVNGNVHGEVVCFDYNDDDDKHENGVNGLELSKCQSESSENFHHADISITVAPDYTGNNNEMTFVEQIKDRSSWLIGLLILQSFSSFILKSNEDLLTGHPEIVHFLTMLVGAGGNAGNQACVRVIRELALGRLSGPRRRAFLWNEVAAAACISAVLTLSGLLRVTIFRVPRPETVAITLSLMTIVTLSIGIGALLPLAMAVVGIDPAHSSTTIQVVMDILGVTITCAVSTAVIGTFASFQDDESSVWDNTDADDFFNNLTYST